MLFHLIAVFMIGVLGASVAYIAFRLSGRRLSKAIIPFAAGLAMLAYSIWNESTWFTRTLGALPPSFALVEKGQPVVSPLSPWTYLLPRTDSFLVLAVRAIQPLPASEGRYLAQVHKVSRFDPVAKSSWVVDCQSQLQAEIVASTKFDANGLPSNPVWSKADDHNAIAKAVCTRIAAPTPAK